MKGVLEGLKALQQAADATNKGGGDKGSAFLKLSDGESARVRFLQELDSDGSNFDKKRGVAKAYFEHANPQSGNPRFICTMEEEGKCYGCELGSKNPRWKKRARLYINAMLREGNNAGSVVLVNQGLSTKSIGTALIEFAGDNGSIMDRDYKIKRIGEGLQTTYQLYPQAPSALTKEDNAAELIDPTKFVKALAYDEQVDAVNNSGTPSNSSNEW